MDACYNLDALRGGAIIYTYTSRDSKPGLGRLLHGCWSGELDSGLDMLKPPKLANCGVMHLL